MKPRTLYAQGKIVYQSGAIVDTTCEPIAEIGKRFIFVDVIAYHPDVIVMRGIAAIDKHYRYNNRMLLSLDRKDFEAIRLGILHFDNMFEEFIAGAVEER